MTPRTVEDRLREEYSLLSPEIKRVLHQLQTDVAYLLLPVTLELQHHERIHVEARAKECDSAINALRRREEARQFDEDAPTGVTLTNLPDLVGLRVLVFPKFRLEEVHRIVRERGAAKKPAIREQTERVYDAFEELEEVLELELQRNAERDSG